MDLKGGHTVKYIPFKNNYDKFPKTHLDFDKSRVFSGFQEIITELSNYHNGTLAIEIYPGNDIDLLFKQLITYLPANKIINIETAKKSYEELSNQYEDQLTDDRVFGVMGYSSIEDFYQLDKIQMIRDQLAKETGLNIVYGFGATLVKYDYLVYIDITRWEIQLRFRKGMPNFTSNNPKEDTLKKFKRGYFLEWRVADKIKQAHYLISDYLISGDNVSNPVMIPVEAFIAGIDKISSSPFRLIPYFDPGIWGGQWMKEVCNLPENGSNYAWSFDGVPEENALAFAFGDINFIFPAINLVFFRPKALLGERVYGRFGKEFPIRFDFLDTMEGGNLSLQVHPLTEYIKKTFGMHYTQDESYYILDAKEDSVVYLGVKPNINPDDLIRDLEKANHGGNHFNDELYINSFQVRKHDHLLIPAGTIHCSGKNTMVLEISATPYIFTFKLWDWGRLGLDGLPRPVHINHGKNVIQYDRDTEWVKDNLINRFETINDHEIKTGLHELEFIETRRLTVTNEVTTQTHGSVNVLNLVEGKAAIISSPERKFDPFTVHYAETFIIPDSVKNYTIATAHKGETIMIIKAFVR